MADVTRLRPKAKPTESGDPLRKALAAAIVAAGKAREMRERQKQAVGRLWAEMREAEQEIERLQKRVSEAQEAHIAGLADAATSGKAAPVSGVAKARAAVVVAEDHREALRAARKKLEADMPEVEKDVVAADTEVERLISEILAPVAEQMIQRGREIAAMLAPIRSTLTALWAEETPAAWDAAASHDKGRQPLKEVKQAAADWLRESSAFSRAVPDPWLNARLALKQDAQAELPLDELSSLLG
jgi:hypothetical protein